MEGYLKGFELSNLWTCKRSVEASCARRTEALLKFVDTMFEDMRNEIDETFRSDRIDAHSFISDQRISIDRIRMLLHMNSMQLEIFRRVVQDKQETLEALEIEKSKIMGQINERRSPIPLPTLPNEILGQIFAHLYWSETDSLLPGYLDFPADGFTLQRLIDDGTTPEWKTFINNQLPCILTTSGTEREWRMFANFFGPHPRILRLQDLHQIPEDVLERPSTIVSISLSDGLGVMEELENIRQKPWRDIFFSVFAHSESSTTPKEVLKGILQSFGDKMARLDRLTFYENSPNTYDAGSPDQASSFAETKRLEGLASSFNAYLPLHLVPTFHPITSNISDLETTIPMTFESIDPTSDVENLFQVLMLCSKSLTSLTITQGPTLALPSGSQARVRRPILFPQLKRLDLNSLPESIVSNILSSVECSSLRHFSLLVLPDIPGGNSQTNKGTTGRISANSLSILFPHLNYISASLGELKQDARFLTDLASPDESGSWFFPLLNSMRFGTNRASLAHLPLLRAVTDVVLNRMRSDAVNDIRYLTIPEFIGAESVGCDALKLFVPEIHFIPDANYNWFPERSW
ncbi:hypothetical protein SCHPADRAFT_902337 [Schizopora paradoxa]|uniref:Uncharacterized protein n=1 Tax=Schizopora paradoxa TaxID=27342 RepID=A0A0H2RTY6_9AGAM|nr:hypothetical protein SCHPADRAFT_902337 [Schizopora paradoxa]